MDLGGPQRMPGSLHGGQVEDGAVDVGHGQLPFREDLLELLDGRLLDVRDEAKMPREAREFTDLGAVLLQARLTRECAFPDVGAQRRQDHAQARQGAGVAILLFVERKP
jgi:hypothetical protein